MHQRMTADDTVPSAEGLVAQALDSLSYADAVRLAMTLHRRGLLDDAERVYRACRQVHSDDPNPMHYLGVLLHQRGRQDEALTLIRQSLDADPTVAAWHNNLGNVLLEHREPAAAADAYRRCIELDADNFEVRTNLSILLRQMGRVDEAESLLRQAVARWPEVPDAHSNLATLFTRVGKIDEAFVHFARALELQPSHAPSRRLLGAIYAKLGRLDDAANVYREWLQQEPGNSQALHHLAAVTGERVPERASDDYVSHVFDNFANSFDERLSALEYRAPALVASAVDARLGSPRGALDVLDAGCGTGLCAEGLRPHARRLVGVDLSKSMLEKAHFRGNYDQLAHGELVAFISAHPAAFDLIASADTLCYFGRLDAAMAACRASLRPGGLLAFTVEALAEDGDFALLPHGRYSHAHGYLQSVLADAGFDEIELSPVVLRNEGGKPVDGWLAAARAAAGRAAPN